MRREPSPGMWPLLGALGAVVLILVAVLLLLALDRRYPAPETQPAAVTVPSSSVGGLGNAAGRPGSTGGRP